MAYYVQVELISGVSHHIAWFDCDVVIDEAFASGWSLLTLWPGTILTDRKGADGADLRSIANADDSKAKMYSREVSMLALTRISERLGLYDLP